MHGKHPPVGNACLDGPLHEHHRRFHLRTCWRLLGADTFYYGLFPLLGKAGSAFGVPPLDVGVAMLIGKNVAMILSPLQPPPSWPWVLPAWNSTTT